MFLDPHKELALLEGHLRFNLALEQVEDGSPQDRSDQPAERGKAKRHESQRHKRVERDLAHDTLGRSRAQKQSSAHATP